MRILFIDPPQTFLRCDGQTRQVQPLGIACLGAFLTQHGHDVRFLLPDTRAYTDDDPWGEIVAAVVAEKPDVVGLTGVTAVFPQAAHLAGLIRETLPSVPIIMGGVHASSMPDHVLENAPAIDFVCVGEGEHTMLELMTALAAGPVPPGSIDGLVSRAEDGLLVHGGRRAVIEDLDLLPLPQRTGLVWPQDLHPVFYQALITLRGCPYRCIYCAVPSQNDRKTRYRSPDHVVGELRHLIDEHGINYLFFHDSVFSLNRKRTLTLCQALVDADVVVPFSCQTRADRVDAEVLGAMAAAGCRRIFLGIESGTVESLKRMHKKMALTTITDAVALIKKHGIECNGYFMVGFPWETAAMMRATADFATSLDLDGISLFSATPLPGTELWEMAGGGHLPDSIDFRTPQVNLTGLGNAEYRSVFGEVKAKIDAFNQGIMERRYQAALSANDATRRWLDG